MHLYLFYSSTEMFSWDLGRECLQPSMLNQKSSLTIWISHLLCGNLLARSPQSKVVESDFGSARYQMYALGLTYLPPWASFPPVKIRDRGGLPPIKRIFFLLIVKLSLT